MKSLPLLFSLTPEERLWATIDRVIRESGERLAVIFVTQPFQVFDFENSTRH
jgi:hypothetical protein